MEIDPEDDSLDRWIVRHYRYDPQRRQRRHVTVAAYSSRAEMNRAMDDLAGVIRDGIATGERDTRESVTGVHHPPGHLAAQAVAHRVRRAVEHGVDPRLVLDGDRLPSNVAILSWSDDGGHIGRWWHRWWPARRLRGG
ncbi:MAG: hypothetical protein ACK5MP_00585 [Nostocoides sp.]